MSDLDTTRSFGADIVLGLSCPDRAGIVAAVALFIASRDGLITEAAHFVDDYSQRSFRPGFKGARPYHQAYIRGVKIIGATAHYVTPELDEGPIIEQGVERVDHTMNPKDLVEIGHDLESLVLNRAVRWHAEHRVFESRGRTVVLRS